MLQEDASRILDFWEGVDRVNPLPDHWQQTAVICSELSRVIQTIVAVNGGKIDPISYTEFMPPRWRRPDAKVEKAILSDDDLAKALDAKFGGQHG